MNRVSTIELYVVLIEKRIGEVALPTLCITARLLVNFSN
jgi:hypothetical protein